MRGTVRAALRRGVAALVCATTAAVASAPAAAADRDALAAFHRAVLDVALDPPPESRLRRVCAATAEAGGLTAEATFAGFGSGRAEIAILTTTPVHDLARTVWLKPRFVAAEDRAAVERAWPELTLDWGWVYDRNGDGRLDWFAFVIGPVAVAPEGERDLPRLPGPMTKAEMRLLVANTPYRFWQIVDSDFDGAPDALLAPAMRRDGWAEGVMLLEGIERPGGPSACCWRSERQAGPGLECRPTPSGCETRDGALSAISARFGPDILPRLARFFRLAEAGARACDLAPGTVPKAPAAR
jgi:hypothetical protein